MADSDDRSPSTQRRNERKWRHPHARTGNETRKQELPEVRTRTTGGGGIFNIVSPQVHDVALELVRALKPLVAIIGRHDRSLEQIKRSGSGIALALGEGVYSRKGNQPAHDDPPAFHTAVPKECTSTRRGSAQGTSQSSENFRSAAASPST